MNLPDLTLLQNDAAAAKPLADIAAGKWRKARDAARELCRAQKERYLPLLIAANAGLAHDLLERGLTQDAATVLAYLKTIAPPEMVEALQMRRQQEETVTILKKGSPAQAAATAWEMVSTGVSAGKEVSPAIRRAVDLLVTARSVEPCAGAPELRAELLAVRKAVEATARGEWEEAVVALRALSRDSLFQSWRLFLRGVRCAHTGDLETARQCFAALPAGSAVARAADVYRSLCGAVRTADRTPEPARITFMASLCGAPESWGPAIAAAESFWQKNRLGEACTALLNGMGRGQFPTDAPGLAGSLSDLFFANDLRGANLKPKVIDDYVTWLDSRLDNKSVAPMGRKMLLREMCLLTGGNLPPSVLGEFWEEIITLDEILYGKNPLRAAAAWEGAAMQMPGPGESGLAEFHMLLGGKDDITRLDALRKCAEFDPGSADRTLARVAELRKVPDGAQEIEAQLAKAVLRFPEHPGILREAGRAALIRGDTPAAIGHLRKARRVDPGNAEVSQFLAAALLNQISNAHTAAPETWDELDTLTEDAPPVVPVYHRKLRVGNQRWVSRVTRSMIDPDGEYFEKAVTLAPSRFAAKIARAAVALQWSLTTIPDEVLFAPEANGVLRWEDLIWAIHIIAWGSCRRKPGPWMVRVEKMLSASAAHLLTPGSLKSGAHTAAWGVLEFAMTVTEYLADSKEDELPQGFISEVAQALAAPKIRYLSYKTRFAGILLPASCNDEWLPCSCAELDIVSSLARLNGDESVYQAAQSCINKCGDTPTPRWAKKRPAIKAAKKKTAARVRTSPPKKVAAAKPPAPKAAADPSAPDYPELDFGHSI